MGRPGCDGQTETTPAIARLRTAVQALEGFEDPRRCFSGDPDPLVGYGDAESSSDPLSRHVQLWCLTWPNILESVGDEVPQDLSEQHLAGDHRGEGPREIDGGTQSLNVAVMLSDDLRHQDRQIDRADSEGLPIDAGILQKLGHQGAAAARHCGDLLSHLPSMYLGERLCLFDHLGIDRDGLQRRLKVVRDGPQQGVLISLGSCESALEQIDALLKCREVPGVSSVCQGLSCGFEQQPQLPAFGADKQRDALRRWAQVLPRYRVCGPVWQCTSGDILKIQQVGFQLGPRIEEGMSDDRGAELGEQPEGIVHCDDALILIAGEQCLLMCFQEPLDEVAVHLMLPRTARPEDDATYMYEQERRQEETL